ncbi:MAG: ABC transporter permease [Candidatus Limnocylindria bacterium]
MTTAASSVGGRRPSLLRELASSALTIMVKELRSRFRGRRSFLVLTLYLSVLALIAYGAYGVVAPEARLASQSSGGLELGTPNASARIGQAIFAVLSVIQLLLVSFLAPAFTTGAISLEREKQTLDLLIATPIRPAGLVIGKLVSALAFVVLMIVAGIPVSALVLMYGGATVDDILRQQAVLFAAAIGFGVIGLFYSALTKRTQTATVLTYSTILALTIGTLLVWRFWTAVATDAQQDPFGRVQTAPEELLYVNPAVAMIEIVANTELEFGDFSEAYYALRGGVVTGVECSGDVCFPITDVPVPEGVKGERPIPPIGGDDAPGLELRAVPPVPNASTAVSNHFWPRVTATYGAISILLTLAAMRLVLPAGTRLRLPARRRRPEAGASIPLDPISEEQTP